MPKMITVAKRGELKKSQKGNAYFLVTDTDGVNYVCFHSAQYADFPEDAGVYCKIIDRIDKDSTIEVAKDGEEEAPTGAVVKTPIKPQSYSRGGDTNRSIEKQVALKGAVEIVKALIESKTWGKDDLTNKKINFTVKQIASSNDEWLMSSTQVAEKIQEEIDKE